MNDQKIHQESFPDPNHEGSVSGVTAWLDRHKVRIWVSLSLLLLIVWGASQANPEGSFAAVDPLLRGALIIIGFPVVVSMIVSGNPHGFTPLGLLAGLLTLVIEVTCLVFVLVYLIRGFRNAHRRNAK